jgi:hypothetical protein
LDSDTGEPYKGTTAVKVVSVYSSDYEMLSIFAALLVYKNNGSFDKRTLRSTTAVLLSHEAKVLKTRSSPVSIEDIILEYLALKASLYTGKAREETESLLAVVPLYGSPVESTCINQ